MESGRFLGGLESTPPQEVPQNFLGGQPVSYLLRGVKPPWPPSNTALRLIAYFSVNKYYCISMLTFYDFRKQQICISNRRPTDKDFTKFKVTQSYLST